MRLVQPALALALALSFAPALAQANAQKVARANALALGATEHSRAASRRFHDVIRASQAPGAQLEVIEAKPGAPRHEQVQSSYSAAGPHGTRTTHVSSATVHGKTFSEYGVAESGVGGPDAMRTGTWTSQRKVLGGLFTINRKTQVSAFYKGNELKTLSVDANRKTLRVLGLPVMWLGKDSTPAELRQRAAIANP